MYLFYDTETTGLPLEEEHPNHPEQPHIVQLAAILMTEDRQEVGSMNVIIRPDGWEIPEEAASVHGINTEMALRYGIPETTAMKTFHEFRKQAQIEVAHRIEFDNFIMRIAYARLYGKTLEQITEMESNSRCCTANAARDVVTLPPTEKMLGVGLKHYKTPTLTECLDILLHKNLENAHNALADVRGCAEVFFYLVDNNHELFPEEYKKPFWMEKRDKKKFSQLDMSGLLKQTTQTPVNQEEEPPISYQECPAP